MAKSPAKSSRSAPDTHPDGFGEAPQPPLSGAPISGSISDWAADTAREAERDGVKARLDELIERDGRIFALTERPEGGDGACDRHRRRKWQIGVPHHAVFLHIVIKLKD